MRTSATTTTTTTNSNNSDFTRRDMSPPKGWTASDDPQPPTATAAKSSPAQSALQAFSSSRSRSSTVVASYSTPASSSSTPSPATLGPLTRANTSASRATPRRPSFDVDHHHHPRFHPRQTSPTSLPATPSLSARDAASASASSLDPTNNAAPSQLDAKVCVLGSQGAGKTSLVHRYTTGQFSNTLNSTIGASFMTKRIVMPDCKVRLQIWDTAGQERFRSMTPIYYRGSHAAILVYDITSNRSFQDIRLWLQELRENMSSDLVVHVVGSKADLEDQREVDLDSARLQLEQWIREDPDDDQSDVCLGGGVGSSASASISAASAAAAGNATAAAAAGPASPTPVSNPGSPALASSPLKGSSRMGFVHQLSFGGGGPGRKSQDELANQVVPEREPWCRADISEVSAKSDFGIEEVFLNITQRLVDRKNNIEQDRILRSRNSVILDQETPQESQSGWACC